MSTLMLWSQEWNHPFSRPMPNFCKKADYVRINDPGSRKGRISRIWSCWKPWAANARWASCSNSRRTPVNFFFCELLSPTEYSLLIVSLPSSSSEEHTLLTCKILRDGRLMDLAKCVSYNDGNSEQVMKQVIQWSGSKIMPKTYWGLQQIRQFNGLKISFL